MKGIAPLVIILIAALVVGGAATTYYVATNDTPINVLTVSPEKESIIPKSVMKVANEEVLVTGLDFEITCDKNVYTGMTSITVLCDVKNLNNVVIKNQNMSLLFNPEIAGLGKVYLWDENVVIGEECSSWKNTPVCMPINQTGQTADCYTVTECTGYSPVLGGYEETNKVGDSVKGLTFGKLETKHFKFIVNVPADTEGKFDIVAGQTILDPWWDSSYSYRYQILENYTSSLAKSINDTDGIRGTIIWSDTWNDSFVYSTGLDITGTYAIANETAEKNWEKEHDGSGNNPEDVWIDAVGVWHFGEGTGGVIRDSTSNNNDGTFSGTNWTSSGKFGNATGFTGNGLKNVTIPHSASINVGGVGDSFTVTAWMKKTVSATTYETIAGKRDCTAGGYPFILGVKITTNQGYFAAYDGVKNPENASGAALNDGNWHHLVLVRDVSSGYYYLYIDGKLSTQTLDTTTATTATTGSLRFGSICTGASTWGYIGETDDIRIYDNVAKSDNWIKQQYYNGLGNLTEISTGYEVAGSNITELTNNYMPIIYEATLAPYNATIEIENTNQAIVTGYVNFAGTQYSATMSNTTPTTWGSSVSITHGLTETNNAMKTFFWNYTFNYNNGTVVYNQTLSPDSQTLTWTTYFGAPTASDATPVATDSVQLNATLTKHTLATVTNQKVYINSTAYTVSSNGNEYYRSYTTPMVTSPTVIPFYFDTYVTYGGSTYNRSSAGSSFEIQPIEIMNCASGGIPTINFRYFQEENPYQPINATHNIAITIWKTDISESATFNFTLSSNINHTLCLSPTDTDVYAFSVQEYWNPGAVDGQVYPARNYYLNGLHLTNTSQNVDLYLLNDTYASIIGVNVINGYGDGMNGVIVDAARYYPGDNVYRTVARGYTNYRGEAVMRLFKCTEDKNVIHKFTLYQNFESIGTYESLCIIDDIVTLPVTGSSAIGWWDIYGDASASCTWTNSTQVLTCEYVSNGGNTYDAELYVQQIEVVGTTEKCNATTSGASGTLLCDLSGMTDEQYYYIFHITNSDGVKFVVDSETIKNLGSGQYSNMGIFIAFLLVVFLAFVGWQNPLVMMLLSIVGIIAGFAMGLYEVTWAGLVSIVIAGVIILKGVSSA